MDHLARLRKVGGSVMVAIPPAVLEELKLRPDSDVAVSVKGGRLVIDPKAKPRPRYTLDQLIKEGRNAKNLKFKDKAWLNMPRAGREII
jgi:antitoxin ChpS